MKQFQSTQSVLTKALVAVLVTVALASLIHVATKASAEAVVAKQTQFDEAQAIQLAAKERKGHAVAQK